MALFLVDGERSASVRLGRFRPVGFMTGAAAPAAGDDDVGARLAWRLQADLFRALGHPTRVQLLEVLGDGEWAFGELRRAVALESGSTAQHLAVLRRHGLVQTRKDGTSLRCRVADVRTLELLAVAWEVLIANIEEHRALLDELDASAPSPSHEPRRSGA